MRAHSPADDTATRGAEFLTAPEPSPDARLLYDDDLAELGFVTNSSQLWGHHPGAAGSQPGQLEQAAQAASLSQRQRYILIAASASTYGDSYCSLVWGTRLAADAGSDVVAAGHDQRFGRGLSGVSAVRLDVTASPARRTASDVFPVAGRASPRPEDGRWRRIVVAAVPR